MSAYAPARARLCRQLAAEGPLLLLPLPGPPAGDIFSGLLGANDPADVFFFSVPTSTSVRQRLLQLAAALCMDRGSPIHLPTAIASASCSKGRVAGCSRAGPLQRSWHAQRQLTNTAAPAPPQLSISALVTPPSRIACPWDKCNRANLDLQLQLLDGQGRVLAAANPPVGAPTFENITGAMSASLKATTPGPGQFYVSVSPVGWGDPKKGEHGMAMSGAVLGHTAAAQAPAASAGDMLPLLPCHACVGCCPACRQLGGYC